MSVIDTSAKFIVALKHKLEPGRATNVCGHLCLGLVAKAAQTHPQLLSSMSFTDYPDADGGPHASISALGLIVLSGKPSWLPRLRDELAGNDILFTDYLSTMVDGDYADQQSRTAKVSAIDLDYLGIAAFGPRSVLDPLTKRFSLWQ